MRNRAGALAAADAQMVAITMTVDRVGDDTPFVRSLIEAAECSPPIQA